ncbi:MAG: winged helix-turn-helix transcriptional regulator [Deltaproteobacteria bacterium]|nr:winged helix-turn-helix transcriptional regulator [Deltaproteobacteria bacterium]
MSNSVVELSSVEILKQALDHRLFKVFSEPVRSTILLFLLQNGKSDVNTISNAFPQDRSVVSRHLSMMKEAGILKVSREDRHRYYEVDADSFIASLRKIIFNTTACASDNCNCCEKCPNYHICAVRIQEK